MIAKALRTTVLSGDGPRSLLLGVLLLAILVGLAFAPFLFPGTRSLNVAAKICVFILLVASYDLLLGYTGIVSFAHTMFFGIGGYGIALAMSKLGVGWGNIVVGTAGALLLSFVLSLAVGLFSLRVKTIFFAMITLAIASFFAILASQLSDFTGGEDGITFRLPAVLSPATPLLASPVFGVEINGRILTYYLVFAGALGGFLLLLRIVNSPFGRVLQAIRENEFRAEAVGYRTVNFRTAASVTIAKKIARTRSENSAITRATAAASSTPAIVPRAMAEKLGPSAVSAIATPYAPMPKNMVCANDTMPA